MSLNHKFSITCNTNHSLILIINNNVLSTYVGLIDEGCQDIMYSVTHSVQSCVLVFNERHHASDWTFEDEHTPWLQVAHNQTLQHSVVLLCCMCHGSPDLGSKHLHGCSRSQIAAGLEHGPQEMVYILVELEIFVYFFLFLLVVFCLFYFLLKSS